MKKHVYGAVCVECGAHLDPGERCDCEKLRAEQLQRKRIKRNWTALIKNVETINRAWDDWMND